MKKRIDKARLHKMKNSCFVKEDIKRIRRQAIEWEKIFAKDTYNKELYPDYTKNSYNSTIRKQTT